ncbi:putative Ca2+-binding protein/EF-hand superfamily protein [Blattamonas nauphoetae]|uniref:Ca2+-binding protein/EF-hand superfamily protein n=1 Tax=Blattamonas nauphoetae TaxID=2049346 RepID=A0ABQ9YMF5_9EUKA|nr:putative Ca2+-binding protein/EF-hand superfamily protein [Blattamonas nauphoetae]
MASTKTRATQSGSKGGRQQVTELQREEIRKAFDCFDTDGSGSVNAFTALKVTLTVLGFQPKKADIRKLLQKERSDVIIDDNTLLDFNTFLDIVTEMMGTPPPERELYKAYHEMGGINPQTGEDRGLGVDELRIVAEERLGLKRGTQRMTDEELQEMVFQTLPKETQVLVMQGKIPLEQQRINLPDFLRMMKKTGQC